MILIHTILYFSSPPIPIVKRYFDVCTHGGQFPLLVYTLYNVLCVLYHSSSKQNGLTLEVWQQSSIVQGGERPCSMHTVTLVLVYRVRSVTVSDKKIRQSHFTGSVKSRPDSAEFRVIDRRLQQTHIEAAIVQMILGGALLKWYECEGDMVDYLSLLWKAYTPCFCMFNHLSMSWYHESSDCMSFGLCMKDDPCTCNLK